MSPSATRFVSRLRRRPAAAPAGSSLIATIALTGVLALLVLASLSYARSTTTQTAREGRGDIALAGGRRRRQPLHLAPGRGPALLRPLDRPAEDPRIDPFGVVHAPGHRLDAGRLVDLRRAGRRRPGRRCRTRASARRRTRCGSRPPPAGLRPGDGAVDRPGRAAASPTR